MDEAEFAQLGDTLIGGLGLEEELRQAHLLTPIDAILRLFGVFHYLEYSFLREEGKVRDNWKIEEPRKSISACDAEPNKAGANREIRKKGGL